MNFIKFFKSSKMKEKEMWIKYQNRERNGFFLNPFSDGRGIYLPFVYYKLFVISISHGCQFFIGIAALSVRLSIFTIVFLSNTRCQHLSGGRSEVSKKNSDFQSRNGNEIAFSSCSSAVDSNMVYL